MKSIARRMKELFIGVAFAKRNNLAYLKTTWSLFTERLDNLFTAETFAEASEFDMARDFISSDSGSSKRPVTSCLPGLCTGKA